MPLASGTSGSVKVLLEESYIRASSSVGCLWTCEGQPKMRLASTNCFKSAPDVSMAMPAEVCCDILGFCDIFGGVRFDLKYLRSLMGKTL